MSTIRPVLASGIHQVTTGELTDLQHTVETSPLTIEVDGLQYAPTLFPVQEKTISVLRPNEAQRAVLADSTEAFFEFLQHAVDVNKDYFVPSPKPAEHTVEYRRHAGRMTAFTKEARVLAHQLYFPGQKYSEALDKIDAVGSALGKQVLHEVTWGHAVPTRDDRMKLIVGDQGFTGYDEGMLWKPRGIGPDGSLKVANATILPEVFEPGLHVPHEQLMEIATRCLEWAHHPRNGGKLGDGKDGE